MTLLPGQEMRLSLQFTKCTRLRAGTLLSRANVLCSRRHKSFELRRLLWTPAQRPYRAPTTSLSEMVRRSLSATFHARSRRVLSIASVALMKFAWRMMTRK